MAPRPLSHDEIRDPRAARIRLEANLARCREAIARAARRAGRDPAGVALVAVTKYAGVDAVRLLHSLGLRDFGENTVQGAESKIEAARNLEGARWHMIGHLQRNKVPRALQLFASIHSIDSRRLAREVAAQAAKRSLPVPGLYVEVNLGGEDQKTGLAESGLRELLAALLADGSLAPRVLGLMAMAPYGPDAEAARPVFRRLRELRDAAAREGLLPSTAGLSMGMTSDLEVAVEEGATVVRVGSMLLEGL